MLSTILPLLRVRQRRRIFRRTENNTAEGAYAILDPHNYMRYNDPSQQPMTGSVIGNSSDPNAATTAQFQAFWHELSGRFKANEKVIFGIMNEVGTLIVLRQCCPKN